MRRLAVALVTALLVLGGTGVAWAGTSGDGHPGDVGPSGSTFTGGNVVCGHTNTFLDSPVVVYNDGRGVEVCSDSGPIQGRIIARHTTGFLRIDYVEIDGDRDNPAPLQGVLLFLPLGLP